MVTIELERQAYFDHATFGELRVFGNGYESFQTFECLTVEPPWANNMPSVSCIPEGTYPVSTRWFNRGGYETWQVSDVPGRTHIMIHKAVVPGHLRGCIGVGNSRIYWKGQWGIGGNTKALEGFLSAMSSTIGGAGTRTIRVYQRVPMATGGDCEL